MGARWDATRKVWYVMSPPNLASFQRWLPGSAAQSESSRSLATPRTSAPRKDFSEGQTVAGTGYFALACDCLPWVGCSRCRETVRQRWGT
ncbi:DUF5710 domain-containing protein [Uliginosibacterium sp. sgz301328]|uniref:DUF5710 domain-containing protein n=1 Tax=Uliginosibacterium sp. sgz301328 TaxID=3243764 RepID=UPI00359CC036